jgi:hypothetical protein
MDVPVVRPTRLESSVPEAAIFYTDYFGMQFAVWFRLTGEPILRRLRGTVPSTRRMKQRRALGGSRDPVDSFLPYSRLTQLHTQHRLTPRRCNQQPRLISALAD